MHGRTTSIHGTTTPHTVSAVHGIGAAITTHGTAARCIGTDGTIHTTMQECMIHGTMADGTTRGITEGCMDMATIHITADGMDHGTLIGDIITTTTTLLFLSTTRTAGMAAEYRQDRKECLQAESPQEEEQEAAAVSAEAVLNSA